MDIVEYLKPRFAIMENVVDIVKFAKGYLGRYALGRLVANNYQARVGLMVAGSYGLPQFRMRMFMWGAAHSEVIFKLFLCNKLMHLWYSCFTNTCFICRNCPNTRYRPTKLLIEEYLL